MVEPPGNVGRAGVFEVDDGVLVAIKLFLVEECAGAVHESGELKFGVTADAFAIEAGKDGGRRSAVETLVVIEDANSQ